MSCVQNMQPELNYEQMYKQWQEIMRQIQDSQKNMILNNITSSDLSEQTMNSPSTTIENEVEEQSPQLFDQDQISELQTTNNDSGLDQNQPRKFAKLPIQKKQIKKINKTSMNKEIKLIQFPKQQQQQQQIYSQQKKQIKKDDHNQFANILNNFINNFVSDFLKKEQSCSSKEQQQIVEITNKLYSKKIFKQLLKDENENKYTKILVQQIREYFKPGGKCEQKYIMEKNSKMKNILGCDDLISQIQEQLSIRQC